MGTLSCSRIARSLARCRTWFMEQPREIQSCPYMRESRSPEFGLNNSANSALCELTQTWTGPTVHVCESGSEQKRRERARGSTASKGNSRVRRARAGASERTGEFLFARPHRILTSSVRGSAGLRVKLRSSRWAMLVNPQALLT